MKITIIGSKGMLGKMVCDYFNKFTNDFEYIIAKKLEIDKEEEFLESSNQCYEWCYYFW